MSLRHSHSDINEASTIGCIDLTDKVVAEPSSACICQPSCAAMPAPRMVGLCARGIDLHFLAPHHLQSVLKA